MGTGIEMISDLISRTGDLRRAFRDQKFSPDSIKTDINRYSMKETANMVGRSHQAIRDAEKTGRIPAPELGENGRRKGFTLKQINQMRDVFGTRPSRDKDEEPVIIAVQNFKGGVAKSTISTHLAEYISRSGYRVLLVDCDSQASSTGTFGYVPDDDIKEEDTLLPFFRDEEETLHYAIRTTYWDGLDLIPANLHLYSAEYELASDVSSETFSTLRDGIATVADDYDVVIIDPPPALGMISLNVIYAANALVIPMPPSMYDFASTISFLTMLQETMSVLERAVGTIDYKFVKLVLSRYDENKSAQEELVKLIEGEFGNAVLGAKLRESAEIVTASYNQRTVYELEPTSSSKVRKRCLNILDSVNSEIELLIRESWPSHAKKLRDEGIL
ncbi:MAG: AAA family ATPase [Gammaproteobacteria bacterium]|nr:AAA family ATPase [Gammaproteobacteria bacterium]